MAVTAAQAISAYKANKNVAAQVVADTSANVLTNLAGLQALQAAGKLTSVSLTGPNVSSAAQAKSIAGLPNLSLVSGATLVVTDTAANIILAGNAAGLAKATSIVLADTAANLLSSANAGAITKATSVQLTGTSNAVTAAQATTLAGLKGFAMGSGATLVVTDTAANIILAGNAEGLAKASSIVLADTAANLLSSANAAAITKASSVTLTGRSNAVTAAQATTIVGLKGFAMGSGATLVVTDTAANLISSVNAAAIAKATSVQLTGTSNAVTAAQATTLAGLKGFAMDSGATLVVTDTAANILLAGNATGLAKATSIVLADTMGNLLSPANAGAITKATSVQLSGANSVNAAGAKILAGLKGFAIGPDATLVVADSAENILLTGNGSGIAKATSIKLTGYFNPVTAAQATSLVKLKGFAIAAGAKLDVTDTAANILMAENASGIAKATSIVLDDTAENLLSFANAVAITKATFVRLTGTTNTVTAAQATTLAALKGFFMGSGATLVIMDTASNILLASNTKGLVTATSVQLTGSNSVTAAQATTLTGLKGFAMGSGATLRVTDTAANILTSSIYSGLANATSFELTGANSVSAYQSAKLAGLKGFTMGSGSTLVVTDTAANIILAINAAGLAKATSIVLADTAANLLLSINAGAITMASSVKLTGTSNPVTAAQATTLAGLKGFAMGSGATLVVTDTAANIILAGNETGLAKATSIVLADTAANLLSPANASAITKATSVQLTAANNAVTATQATTLAGLKGFAMGPGAPLFVTDTAANILLASNAKGIAQATSVQLTGANSVTAAQATTLAYLRGFKVGLDATLVVKDTAANILSSSTYRATSVVLTGANSVTAAQATRLAGLTGFAMDSGATLVVTDTVANILMSNNASGLAKKTSTVLTDTVDHLLDPKNAALVQNANGFVVIGSNTVTAAQATAVAKLPQLTIAGPLMIADSGANLALAANAIGVSLETSTSLVGGNRIVPNLNVSIARRLFISQYLEITGSSSVDVLELKQYVDHGDRVYVDPGNGGLGYPILIDVYGNNWEIPNDQNLTGVKFISLGSSNIAATLNLSGQSEGFLIAGTSFGDTLTGGQGADQLLMGSGNDTVNEFVGADSLYGGGGFNVVLLNKTAIDLNLASDEQIVKMQAVSAEKSASPVTINLKRQSEAFTITGGLFSDVIVGGNGGNTIIGGAGADILTGGNGSNIFDYAHLSDSLVASFDTITDFKSSDQIKLGHKITAAAFFAVSATASENLASDLAANLNATNFVASAATLINLNGTGSDAGTYLVINNSVAGFQSGSDAVVKLQTGATVTASNFF